LVRPDKTCRNQHPHLLPHSVCLLQPGNLCVYTSHLPENRYHRSRQINGLCADYYRHHRSVGKSECEVEDIGGREINNRKDWFNQSLRFFDIKSPGQNQLHFPIQLNRNLFLPF
jgi:hypothetical protein